MRCGRLILGVVCAVVAASLTLEADGADGIVASAAGATPVVNSGSKTPVDEATSPITLIDKQVAQAWRDHDLVPSPEASDGEWCRRVFLDVIGRVPTVEEVRAFSRDRKRDKRERLVDRLLGSEYRDEYVRNWTTEWTNLLIGRTGGTERQSLVNRAGMQQYLREALSYNRPYDQMARELVTASGSCRPGDKDFNGAANFLADKMAENGVQATAKTSQVFLGMAVQCTQCHNHPFNEHQQNQFWELNAFFRQTRVERIRLPADQRQRFVGRVVERDFRGETGDVDKADLFYELRNGQMKVAYPVFVDGTSLASMYREKDKHFGVEDFGDSGKLADVNRRAELAKLIVASREFDRAIVNRLWGHFLGHGFTKPVDDIGPHNTPSHPELLDGLGMAFRNSQFDLKQLMRWIVLSKPYRLSSRMTKENAADDPELGARPMFSHFYLRQMEAEQLYESLLVATAADETVKDERRDEVRERWLRQFNTAFGTDDGGEATSFNGSIPQALALMNGPLVQRATGNQKGSMLARVTGNAQMNSAEKIRYLYLAALARRPTRQETSLANDLLAARGGDVGAALQDIWWALLNSNEFILIH
jgi:hypothetical protein